MFTVVMIRLIIKLIMKLMADDEIATQLKIRKGTKRHKEFVRLVRVLRKSMKDTRDTKSLEPIFLSDRQGVI
mgnify:CR=1 FL=1